MESFQPSGASTHRPLQGKEIRIVTLHPGSFNDPVFCTLDYVVLDGPRDDYVAISYTWGDPTQTEDINLNGHAYPVTLNLRSALAYLRNEDGPRRLWIDSLCINQRDMVERSAQIPRMRDVFAFAAEVHIWLGDYGSIYDELSWKSTFDGYTDFVPKDNEILYRVIPLSDNLKLYALEVLKRPWFQRMWVIQEVAVRNWKEDGAKVKFLVGHLSLTWSFFGETFGRVVHLRSYLALSQEQLGPGRIHELNGLFEIRTAWEAEHRVRESPMESVSHTMSQQLGYLLSRFVKFKVTDPRDRIYSLLGLLYGPGKVPDDLAPDYSKPVDEVFHAYAAWMLRDGACIDILSLNSRQRVGRRCPSWVPDFQGEKHEFWQNFVDNPVKILQENRVLEIDALTIGTVHIAGKRCDILAKSKTKYLLEFFQNCRQYLLDCEVWVRDHATDLIDEAPRTKLSKYFEKSYRASSFGLHKFFETCGERYDGIFRDHYDLDDTWNPLNAMSHIVNPYAEYADFITCEFDGFTPFICDNGKLEFCNNKVDVPEPGDVLCLLRGSSKQYILRRAPADSLGEWIIVGTSYNASECNYVEPVRDGRPEEEANITYTELWTKNEDKIFRAVIC